MPTPETEAQIEGAKNLWRFNRGDLVNVGLWVGLFVICAGAVVLFGGFLHLLPHHTITPTCNTVAQCNRAILSHPIHVKAQPGFPVFKGP